MTFSRVISCFGFLLLSISLRQEVSAQCVVQVMKWCSAEHFQEECLEPCANVDDNCGFFVRGDWDLTFSGVENGNQGMTDIGYYPYPRWCGEVRVCKCVLNPFFGPTCTYSTEKYSDYWVSESYGTGGQCPD